MVLWCCCLFIDQRAAGMQGPIGSDLSDIYRKILVLVFRSEFEKSQGIQLILGPPEWSVDSWSREVKSFEPLRIIGICAFYSTNISLFGLSLIKSDDKPRSGHLNDKNVSLQPYWIGLTANAGITVLLGSYNMSYIYQCCLQ